MSRRWRVRALFNGVGAVTTGIVAIVVGIAKFLLGAWIVLLLIPMLRAADAAHPPALPSLGERAGGRAPAERPSPQRGCRRWWCRSAAWTGRRWRPLNFARSISNDVTAVHVVEDYEEAESFRARLAMSSTSERAAGHRRVALPPPARPAARLHRLIDQHDPGDR